MSSKTVGLALVAAVGLAVTTIPVVSYLTHQNDPAPADRPLYERPAVQEWVRLCIERGGTPTESEPSDSCVVNGQVDSYVGEWPDCWYPPQWTSQPEWVTPASCLTTKK